MLHRTALTRAILLLLCTNPAVAAGQAAQYDAPAYVAAVDGAATLERNGRVETSLLNMPLLSGDRLRTAEGRLEVRFADGGRLFLDRRTSVDVVSNTLVRVVEGRVRVQDATMAHVEYCGGTCSSTFDEYGAGEYQSDYGYVWYAGVAGRRPLRWNNRAVVSTDGFNVGAGYYAAGPQYYSAGTVVPRYVSRGNEIVRSQTAPAIAPPRAASAQGGGAVPRHAESPSFEHQSYAWDNPVYRPPSADRRTEGAVQRGEPQSRIVTVHDDAPSYQRSTAGMGPRPAEYPRGNPSRPPAAASAGSAERPAPASGADRVAPRSSAATPAPPPHVETRPAMPARPAGGR